MKKTFIIIFSLFFTSAFSQSFWQQLVTYPGTHAVNKINAACTGKIFIASDGDGIFYSEDLGTSWNFSNNGLSDSAVKSLACKNDSILFAGAKNRIVLFSYDTGNTWISNNMYGTGNIVSSFLVMPNGDVFAGQTADGIFLSTDNGQTWLEVGLCCAGVLSIIANNAGVIFAGTNAGGVYRSTNGGTVWDVVNNGITNMKINALAVNGTGDLFAGTNGGMFRSSDNGDNWTQINSGLTTLTITDIAIHKSGHIFITTDSEGVFTSTDNGTTWISLNAGLSSLSTTCISVDSFDYIYCGTNDGLLFRSLIPHSGLTDISQNSLQLLQNFPNPFNSSTIIPFILKKEGYVLITISDINGRHIETVLHARLPAGCHQLEWNPKNLCTGIYITTILTDYAISKFFMTFADN